MQGRRAEKDPTDPVTMQSLRACQQQAVPRPCKTEHLSLDHGVGYGVAIGHSDNGRPRREAGANGSRLADVYSQDDGGRGFAGRRWAAMMIPWRRCVQLLGW